METKYSVLTAAFADLTAWELALQCGFDFASPDFLEPGIVGVLPNSDRPTAVSLLSFGEPTPDPEVERAVRAAGLRDATVHEFLAFALQHPDVARAFPVVTRRPICVAGRARRAVPCLLGDRHRRDLMAVAPLEVWSAPYRFACVPVAR